MINLMGMILIFVFFKNGDYFVVGNSVGKIYVYVISLWDFVVDCWLVYIVCVICIVWDDIGVYVVSGSFDINVFVWCLEKKN